jgi:protein gp37
MFREQERYKQDPTKVRRTAPATFGSPLRWKAPRLIFTCSWSDFFHIDADNWRAEAWDIIRRTPHHTYQVLTKRPERILEHLPADWGEGYPNVWLGTSVENQRWVTRVPLLLAVPARVHWISAEPLLGPLSLAEWMTPPMRVSYGNPDVPPSQREKPGAEILAALQQVGRAALKQVGHHLIDWVVVGGESGPEHRPMKLEWARQVRDDCVRTGTAFHFKQVGGVKPTDGGRLLDGREWNDFPPASE